MDQSFTPEMPAVISWAPQGVTWRMWTTPPGWTSRCNARCSATSHTTANSPGLPEIPVTNLPPQRKTLTTVCRPTEKRCKASPDSALHPATKPSQPRVATRSPQGKICRSKRLVCRLQKCSSTCTGMAFAVSQIRPLPCDRGGSSEADHGRENLSQPKGAKPLLTACPE